MTHFHDANLPRNGKLSGIACKSEGNRQQVCCSVHACFSCLSLRPCPAHLLPAPAGSANPNVKPSPLSSANCCTPSSACSITNNPTVASCSAPLSPSWHDSKKRGPPALLQRTKLALSERIFVV